MKISSSITYQVTSCIRWLAFQLGTLSVGIFLAYRSTEEHNQIAEERPTDQYLEILVSL